MIRKLRWKVVAITMLFVSAVMLAVFVGVYFNARTTLRQSAEQQLHQALQRGDGSLFRPGQDSGSLPSFVVEVYSNGAVRVSGSSYYQIDEALLTEIVAACLEQEEDSGVLKAYHLRYLRSSSPLALRIAFTDNSLVQATLRSLVRTSLFIGLAALVVLLLCCYFLAGLITRPVENAWSAQQRFLSDASHELKTPLTVVLSSAELLGEHTQYDSEAAAYVDNIRSESQRMRALVEDMLTLSRAENTRAEAVFSHVDLSDLAAGSVLRFEPVAYEAGRLLSFEITEGIHLFGDGDRLTQLVGILLDNGIKYAPQGSFVHLTLRQQEKQIILAVENGGDPIPPDRLPHLFERFYRADPSRSDHGSFGLGLSIAQAIAHDHGGTIRAESDARSTRFIVTLPLKHSLTGGEKHA